MAVAYLPEGYRVEKIPGGTRQHFPGGYREYSDYLIYPSSWSWQVEGGTISHAALNKIFKDGYQFPEAIASERSETQLSKLRERISELKQQRKTLKIEYKQLKALEELHKDCPGLPLWMKKMIVNLCM